MKKFLLFAGLAAATLSFVGCNKEADVKGLDGVSYEIVLSDASTRTVNSGMTTKWVEGDALSVFYAPAGQTEYAVAKFDVTDPDQNLAVGEVELTAEAYDWYLFYPYDSHLKTPANTNSGYMTVGGLNQTQKGNDSMAHLAGKNLPVVGVAKNVAVDQKPVVSMKHVSSVVAVNLTNDTDKPLTVSSVSFTAPEDVVGTYYIDFSGEKVAFKSSGDNYVSASVTLSVEDAEAIAPGASAKFYMAVKPFTANVDSELKLVVLADQGEVEKTVTLTQAYTFGGGSIKTLNLSYEAPAVVPTITVADINEAITSTSQSTPSEFAGQLAGATVSFVSGNSAFIQDETAGILLFQSGHGLKAGDVLSGLVSGKGWIRYGVRQLTSLTGFDKASGEAPAALELSLADLLADYDRYVSVRVKLSDVEVTDAITTSDRNGAIKDGESELNLYAQVTNTLDVPLGVYDMVGYPTYYNTTKQLGLWAQDDIVAQDAPFFNAAAEQTEVSATTTSVKINVSGNVAWTAEASDGATLDKESGEGEGVITVSFAKNEDTENPKEYTVFVRTDEPSLVAAGTEEFEINITQAKADAAGTTSVTIDFSEQGYANQEEVSSVTENGVTATFDKGTNPNTPKYFTSGTAIRVYGGGTMTVSADGKTIVSIELTFGSSDGTNEITTDVPTYAEPTWTGEAGSVTFTVGGTSGHRRIKAITVKYSGEAAGPVNPTFTVPETLAVEAGKTAKINVTTNSDGAVTYTSSNTAVATVAADGTVTGVAAGTANVTVSVAATSAYNAASGTVAVTVTEAQTGSDYGKVATITSGKKYLIVGGKQSKVLVPPAGTSASRLESADITVTEGKIASSETTDAYAVTITATGDVYNIVLPNGNFLVYAGSGTNLKGAETASDTWTVSEGSFGVFRFCATSTLEASSVRALAFRGGSNNVFGAYATSNLNGTEYFDIDLYELGAEPVVVPDQPTVITTSINMVGNKSVYVGESFELNATSNVEGAVITYESEDPSIATVNASGVVTGVAEGTVKVYARIAGVEGQYTDAERYCNVTVSTKPVETEGTVVFDQNYLAANKDGSKDEISYTNSSDYGTTEVTELRIYKGKEFVVSASEGYKITSIKMTCTAKGTAKQGPGCWGAGAPEGYSFEADGFVGTWTGSASSVSFTATDNQVRITELVVTYE